LSGLFNEVPLITAPSSTTLPVTVEFFAPVQITEVVATSETPVASEEPIVVPSESSLLAQSTTVEQAVAAVTNQSSTVQSAVVDLVETVDIDLAYDVVSTFVEEISTVPSQVSSSTGDIVFAPIFNSAVESFGGYFVGPQTPNSELNAFFESIDSEAPRLYGALDLDSNAGVEEIILKIDEALADHDIESSLQSLDEFFEANIGSDLAGV